MVTGRHLRKHQRLMAQPHSEPDPASVVRQEAENEPVRQRIAELQRQQLTANGLAASFRERVNEHGWTWITAKQVKFLRALIGREHPEHVDRGGSVTRTGIVVYRHHGWPIIEGPGWQVTEYHNGSGLFKVTE